jgi:hypothetical protein
MACSGGGAPSPENTPVTGEGGQLGPQGPGGGDGSTGGGAALIPSPDFVDVQLSGKPIVQDGSYAKGKLTAHAADSKKQATQFHWVLMGPGIEGAAYGDGAAFAFDLPTPTDKSNYVLTLIGNLGGKAVQKSFSFFTMPKPSAKIVANINQAAGLSVALADKGTVLKGQKIQFSADAKFVTQYKWQISKGGAPATVMGTADSATFEAKDLGQYQVALQVWGDGGLLPMMFFEFAVADNAVAMDVKTSVTREASQFSDILKDQGQYPIDSVITIDAAGIGSALTLMSCVVKDTTNNAEIKATSKTNSNIVFTFNTPAKYVMNCSYTLKTDFIPKDNAPLTSTANFEILPKAKAVMTLDGKTCNPEVPLPFLAGSDVKLSASKSSGNISTYLWKLSAGNLENEKQIDTVLHLGKATDFMYKVTLDANGIGDRDSASCTVIAKAPPNVVIASDSTVQNGRSYISGSYQRAHATVKSGDVTGFDWSLLNGAGTVLKQTTTQKDSDIFEFALNEIGSLTLKLISKSTDFAVPESLLGLSSKVAQVSLITPIDFSTIQSVAALSDTDVYFASPSAIFHKGVDGRVVQVKNIVDHPALPNGFFARNAGDIYLLTTDGGFWRYTFKGGWKYQAMSLGANGLSVTGASAGNTLYVAASNGRLFMVDPETGNGQMIASGSPQHVATLASSVYAVAAKGNQTDSGVMQCTTVSCDKVPWASDITINGDVVWKAIGVSTSAVYLSDASSRINTIKDGRVSKFGSLTKDSYIVAFSRPGSAVYAIGNNGGVYRIRDTGVELLYVAPVKTITAGGVGSQFWVQDGNTVVFVKDTNPNPVVAQKSLGTSPVNCKEQKQMWMVGDVAYVSVCTLENNLPMYSLWSAPYQGGFEPVASLAEAMPIIAVTSDGADGLLVMRSDGTKSFVKQLKSDGTLISLTISLNNGEVFTGMSGKFLITNNGINVIVGKTYPVVATATDASHPVAVGDVLYFSSSKNSRLTKFDLKQNKTDDIANVDPTDPIVDIEVDVLGRIYVLTAKALYRYDNNNTLTKLYDAPGPLMNSMASMNGHHMLLSMGSKGLVMVDVDEKTAQIINVNTEAAGAPETTDVGYNGTEFLFFGRDVNTNALFVHEFGAPQ